ncbi:hypothetical protein WJX81_000762 [Elliptochloris bilobata]|uniref:GST N-terminal domain-containing protein n=1 Tax=Elliptochloris bilobata TaxID=381761 RepID=A0AAW1SJN9_9CHLO
MANPLFEVYVKGQENKLGDCPFCHRVLLTLHEKHVPFTEKYVDLSNKPQWLLEVNPPKGSVPVLKDLVSDKWVPDSAAIVDLLEERFPRPPMGKSDAGPDVGSEVFSSFLGYLKDDSNELDKRRGFFIKELEKLGAYLREHGPFLGGAAPNAADAALAPKLYHAKHALKHYKDFDMPVECNASGELEAVQEYLDRWEERDSWKQSYYTPEQVVEGWKKHLAS